MGEVSGEVVWGDALEKGEEAGCAETLRDCQQWLDPLIWAR